MKKWILTSMAIVSMGLGAAQAEDNVLTPAEVAESYKLMFDGTLASFKANWVNYVQGDSTNTTLSSEWRVNATNKTITLPKGSIPEDTRSVKKYKDFELRWTYKINANQGIVYRALLTRDRAWYTGVEYAINDVTNLGKDNPGAAYDLYAPPTPVPYNNFSSGLWNNARIVAIGDSIEHWSNGVKVCGYKVHSPSFWATYNTSKWVTTGNRSLTNLVPGSQDVGTGYIPEGYLSIQADHGGAWQMKDLKITEKPCFGPIKPDGSVCASTSIALTRSRNVPVLFSAARNGDGFTLSFAQDAVKSAVVIGMDGKVVGQGVVSDAGRKAEFPDSFKTGLYFVRLVTASGAVTQKLNLL
jgi:hypothetical protein